MLLAHVQPPRALDSILGPHRGAAPLVTLHLDAEDADEFFALVEQTACSAQDALAQRRLGHLVDRLNDGLADQVDPGAHLVRPAATSLGYTHKQGQYLAFIYFYDQVHRRPPSEADMQAFFRVSPPAVHQMVLTLQRRQFLVRTPGKARAVRLLLRAEQIPPLDA
jgi:repressor LexA